MYNILSSYHKVPKFWDAQNLCCNLPKIQSKSPNIRVFRQKDANGIANSEDPYQTAPTGCTVCPDLSVQKLRIIMLTFTLNQFYKIDALMMMNCMLQQIVQYSLYHDTILQMQLNM